jgi:dipeptidyl aminopeptidase/acylaminoacyl peptidase
MACGSWPSPITPQVLAQATVALAGVALDGDDVWWLESRPVERGRSVLVRDSGGATHDVTPPAFDVRTRVHEYGGGAWLVDAGVVWFTNFADQRVYRQVAGGEPVALTPEPSSSRQERFADFDLTPDGTRLYCVRERHEDGAVHNELVRLAAGEPCAPVLVAGGHAFYSTPRVSPDGRRLCWLAWDHPNMPWDGTTLYVAAIAPDGSVGGERAVLGGPSESVLQPEWSPDGALHAVSDRTGWWNLYRLDGETPVALHPAEAEFGEPQWQFGYRTYGFLRGGRIACVVDHEGFDRLHVLEPGGELVDAGLQWTDYRSTLVARDDEVAFVGGAADRPTSVVVAGLDGSERVLRRAVDVALDAGVISVPEPITFPTAGGREAHALYYPPRNPTAEPLDGELPPLLVNNHGGPTAQARARLALGVQFWTSRGFAYVDVNYGGSSGYGREYRERLRGNWGVVDVEDCVNAARYLVARGQADPERVAVRGGSAGGFTTLAALAFTEAFAAGASHFGVCDLALLAQDTHKFESRYLDNLVGPYPGAADVYEERSPLAAAERIQAPVIVLQGSEDPIVPVAQAEQIVAALAARGVPHAYVLMEGEQHGFRRADSVMRAATSELSFYGLLFAFVPAGDIEPVVMR